MMNNWFNVIQQYLIPVTCITCGASGVNAQDICKSCIGDLQKNLYYCSQCAKTFPTPNSTSKLCWNCINNTYEFDKTYAPYIYQGIVRYLIITLKFRQQFKNARLLGYLLADNLKKTTKLPEIIIPVPLHKRRLRERRFNQVIEIGKVISKQLGLPIDSKSCIRKRDTLHQVGLSKQQRRKNVHQAFALTKSINAQHVAILDDVMTTGYTTNEIAKLLKNQGIARVDVWVCARA